MKDKDEETQRILANMSEQFDIMDDGIDMVLSLIPV